MVTIFKSQTTQFVYIQGVTHSFAEDFEYVRNGDLFSVNTVFTDLQEISNLHFSKFVGKDSSLNDITFASANDLEAYLVQTFTQNAIGGSGTVYGSNLEVFKNDNVLTNSTTTPLNVINANTAFLPTGMYEIEISYSWNHNSTRNDFQSFLFFDGQPLGINVSGLIHKEEPKDSAGQFMGTGSLQHLPFFKKFVVDVTTVGSKLINLSFNTDTDGCSSSIFETLIKIKRIN